MTDIEMLDRDWPLPGRFDFEGQAVRWGTLGPAEGSAEALPPLVLLHGTPFSSWEWHRVAPWLARRRRVFFHDMPGYGRSDMRDGQDVSLAVQGRVFAALLDHWGLARPDTLPHVVAHDFGGATALRAHLLHGAAYRSLTLVDAVAVRPWGSPFVQHVREHEAAFAGMPAYMHAALLPAYVRTAAHREIADSALAPYLAPWLTGAGQRAFYRQIAQMDLAYTDEVEPLYPTIRCPVQVVWGEADAWIPIERGRALAAAIPGARFVAVPHSGHLMQEDAPEAIVHAVEGFVGELDAAGDKPQP